LGGEPRILLGKIEGQCSTFLLLRMKTIRVKVNDLMQGLLLLSNKTARLRF